MRNQQQDQAAHEPETGLKKPAMVVKRGEEHAA